LEEKLKLLLFNNGVMSELYKAGFIGVKPFLYRDIYLYVDMQMKVNGICKTQAVIKASEKFKKAEQTIWNALKAFE